MDYGLPALKCGLKVAGCNLRTVERSLGNTFPKAPFDRPRKECAVIENALDNILTKLAERDYWDIEVLWNRFGIELPILEWLDSEGLIELRTVSIISSRAGDGHVIHSFETPRPNIKPWFSPMKEGMSWLNVFPRNADDMSHRVSWRNANGACPIKKNDVRDSTPFTNLEQVYDAHNHAPRELRVSVGGRKMLAHRVAMSAQSKMMQVNDARLHASISSVDSIISRTTVQEQVTTNILEYRPATYFKKHAAARLRMAASKNRKSKRVKSKTIDGVKCYCVEDVRLWFPDAMPKDA